MSAIAAVHTTGELTLPILPGVGCCVQCLKMPAHPPNPKMTHSAQHGEPTLTTLGEAQPKEGCHHAFQTLTQLGLSPLGNSLFAAIPALTAPRIPECMMRVRNHAREGNK
jgi:hypothetical protein